jgi:hypothetical protein
MLDGTLLLRRPLLFLFRRQGFDLQCMNPTFSCEFLLEQLVDDPVALDLSGAVELAGDDNETEVCLGRCATGHGLVVLVEVGVVVDLDVASKLLDELRGKGSRQLERREYYIGG